VTRLHRPTRRLAVEALLWAGVFLAALHVLVPAFVERQQAADLERRMEERHRRAEQALAEAARDLDVLLHDPETDEKLRERQFVPERSPVLATPLASSPSGTR